MKKIIITFAMLAGISFSNNAFSQAPNLMSYQAVVRNASNALVSNSAVGVKISILQTTATGTVVYAETQTPITNANGLASFQIGNGTIISGTMAGIDWAAGPYFIKIETDPTGGTTYSIVSTTQLLSVPYAMYAAKSGNTTIFGTKNYVSKFITDSTLGNSQIFNDSTGVGINTIKPISKFNVTGQGTVDTLLGDIWYTGGNSNASRIGTIADNSIVNTSSANIGTYSSASNAKNNVAYYGTTKQSTDSSASYIGLLLDNYDNKLNTKGTVYGIFNDVGNNGKGNVFGIRSFVNHYGDSSIATGIYSNISGAGIITGLDMISQSGGDFDITGIRNITATGGGAGIVTGALNLGDGFGVTYGARNIGYGEDTSASYGAENTSYSFGTGASYASRNAVESYAEGDAYGADISALGGSMAGSSVTNGKTIGANILTSGANNMPLTTVGIKVINNNNDTVTSIASITNIGNPAGYFSATGGSGQGVYGEVVGKGFNVGANQYATGVTGVSKDGTNGNNFGVVGSAANGTMSNVGVLGITDLSSSTTVMNAAIYGNDLLNTTNSYAGYFQGNVFVNGTFTSTGPKPFTIDNPLDPENKLLHHFAIEGPEVLNNYSGNITTDATGKAIVQLPDYFESINKDFRYQLTAIGKFAQTIVSKEISNNQFEITTSIPNVKVSWQVMGVRNDAYMQNVNTMQAVEDKPEQLKGKYFSPKAYNKPASMGTFYIPNSNTATAKNTDVNDTKLKIKQIAESNKAIITKMRKEIANSKNNNKTK